MTKLKPKMTKLKMFPYNANIYRKHLKYSLFKPIFKVLYLQNC